MATRKVSGEPRKCQVEGCGEVHSANGFCRRHNAQMKKKGHIYVTQRQPHKALKVCSVDGCTNPHLAHGYCRKHYEHIKNHGHLLARTRYTSNAITVYEDSATVDLYSMHGEIVGQAIIDLHNVPIIQSRKWCLKNNAYVLSTYPERIYMHRLITGAAQDQMVDHKNGNGLDNRESNLRLCNHTQNACNAGPKPSNRSGHKNVSWSSRHNKWEVRLRVSGEKKYIGMFATLEQACDAASEARIKYHGQFALDWRNC